MLAGKAFKWTTYLKGLDVAKSFLGKELCQLCSFLVFPQIFFCWVMPICLFISFKSESFMLKVTTKTSNAKLLLAGLMSETFSSVGHSFLETALEQTCVALSYISYVNYYIGR